MEELEVLQKESAETQLILAQFENSMMNFLNRNSLPTENVLVDLKQRKQVIKNFSEIIDLIDSDKRKKTLYMSKFIAAISVGLFDAALNYLWDETISQLRERISKYDLEYFFDIATKLEKRNELSSEEDLNKIDDSKLISCAKEIGLISDIGYRRLDSIRYMRNWASAAHPNQTEITGFELLSWLDECIREVVNLPIDNITIKVQELLKNIKTTTLTEESLKNISVFINNMTLEKLNSLAQGLFGIYTRKDTLSTTRQNIKELLPIVWNKIDNSIKYEFGIKCVQFSINGNTEQEKLSRQFLDIVNGYKYLPEKTRAVEIDYCLDDLIFVHNGFNNFYREGIIAQKLYNLIGDEGIPKSIEYKLVTTIVNVYLGNGYGVSWDAEGRYKKIIDLFNEEQLIIAVTSFTDIDISNKLNYPSCRDRFYNIIDRFYERVISSNAKELIDEIKKIPKDKIYTINKNEKISMLLNEIKK